MENVTHDTDTDTLRIIQSSSSRSA